MAEIIRKQIQLIHIAKNQLGMATEEYRALLRERYDSCRTGSCKELSYKDASDFIDHLKSKGASFKPKPRPRKRTKAKSLADFPTEAQKEKIKALAGDIRWDRGQRLGLRGFSMRMLGVGWPQTTGEASKLIEHLKHMRASQQRKGAERG